jgi:hypothetical protein
MRLTSGRLGQDESRGRGRPEKACDLLIDYGWAWVCLEVVSGRLTQQSVARGSGRDFDKDVNKLVEDKLEQGAHRWRSCSATSRPPTSDWRRSMASGLLVKPGEISHAGRSQVRR